MHTLTIRVDQAAANYPEVRLLIDGDDLLAVGGIDRGNDPADILDSGALLPVDLPRRIAFYGCGCGEFSCANVAGLVARRGDVVEWSDFRCLTGAYDAALPDPEDSPDPMTSWDPDFASPRHPGLVIRACRPSRLTPRSIWASSAPRWQHEGGRPGRGRSYGTFGNCVPTCACGRHPTVTGSPGSTLTSPCPRDRPTGWPHASSPCSKTASTLDASSAPVCGLSATGPRPASPRAGRSPRPRPWPTPSVSRRAVPGRSGAAEDRRRPAPDPNRHRTARSGGGGSAPGRSTSGRDRRTRRSPAAARCRGAASSCRPGRTRPPSRTPATAPSGTPRPAALPLRARPGS